MSRDKDNTLSELKELDSLVSIILPNFNKEKYLKRALDSILQQTYARFELIVIDDGSSDQSLNILKRVIDPRVKVLARSSNGGLAVAYNEGISICRGEFVMFWNSDDVMRQNHVGAMLHAITGQSKEFDCIGSRFRYMTNYGLKFGHSGSWSPELLELLRQRRALPFNVPSAIFKRKLFTKDLLFDPKLRQCEDFDFMHRLALNHRIGFLHNHFCGYYRLNLESLSSANWEEQVKFQKLFETSGKSSRPTHGDLVRIRFRRAIVLILYGKLISSIPHLIFSLRDPKYVFNRIISRLF